MNYLYLALKLAVAFSGLSFAVVLMVFLSDLSSTILTTSLIVHGGCLAVAMVLSAFGR